MPTTGLKLPTGAAAIAGTWTTVGNITANDGATASVTPGKNSSAVAQGNNFGISIPAGSTFPGPGAVVAQMRVREASAQTTYTANLIVRVGGAVVYTSAAEQMTTALAVYSFDITQARAWAPADFADGTLDLQVQFTRGNTNTAVVCHCDYVGITVTYTEAAPVSQGTAALRGTGRLSTAGQAGASGVATLRGAGRVAAFAVAEARGSATVRGGARLSAVGTTQVPVTDAFGAATLQGRGALSAAGLAGAGGAVVLSGAGRLASSGQGAALAQSTLRGAGRVSAYGMAQASATATLRGGGALAATGLLAGEPAPTEARGMASLRGAGRALTQGRAEAHGSVIMKGRARMTAAGTVTTPGGGPPPITQASPARRYRVPGYGRRSTY